MLTTPPYHADRRYEENRAEIMTMNQAGAQRSFFSETQPGEGGVGLHEIAVLREQRVAR